MDNVKESNFASVIIYIYNNDKVLYNFLQTIYSVLKNNFKKFEIICVNDCSTDNSKSEIVKFAGEIDGTILNVINMSYFQGVELSMNAGIDLSIGDFIFEFDSCLMDYNETVIMEVYKKSLEGYDIVSAAPSKLSRRSSRFFYKIFNYFAYTNENLKTERFRVISRRAINRVRGMSKSIPYRKALYASSGLQQETIYYASLNINQLFKRNKQEEKMRRELALDSIVLFTNIAYRLSMGMAVLMMGGTLFGTIYTLSVFVGGKNPIEGWTTTMLFTAMGFFGIFTILAIITKYLSLLINLNLRNKEYIFESVEKLTK
jgi:Glycosyltransferases involved in cell wall biogenesis